MADHDPWFFALAHPVHRARHHRRGCLLPRLHHPAHGRALPAAGHHRLGHQSVFPVRQRRLPRRPYRHHRHSAGRAVRMGTQVGPRVLLPDLDRRPSCHADHTQPPRFTRGAFDPRAQGRDGDGRGDGRQYAARQDRHLPDRRPAGEHFGLALRPPAALRQSDALRADPGHRVPVHGGRRRHRPCLGRRPRRRADHHPQTMATGLAAADTRAERQFRDHRLRHRHGAGPATRA